MNCVPAIFAAKFVIRKNKNKITTTTIPIVKIIKK